KAADEKRMIYGDESDGKSTHILIEACAHNVSHSWIGKIKTALAVLGTHALKPAAVEYTYEGEHNVYFVGVNQDSICGARINYQAQKASEGMIDALACKDSKEKARV